MLYNDITNPAFWELRSALDFYFPYHCNEDKTVPQYSHNPCAGANLLKPLLPVPNTSINHSLKGCWHLRSSHPFPVQPPGWLCWRPASTHRAQPLVVWIPTLPVRGKHPPSAWKSSQPCWMEGRRTLGYGGQWVSDHHEAVLAQGMAKSPLFLLLLCRAVRFVLLGICLLPIS